MHDHYHQVIESALSALAGLQQPTGEFPTFSARRLDFSDPQAYPTSIYTTTFVVYALRQLAEHRIAAAIRRRAAAFLLSERNSDGSWSYEGRATTRVPADLDDTACAAAALLSCGEPVGPELFRLLWENEAAPGGPYYTWIGVNSGEHLLARQVDALVQANLLLFSGLAGIPLAGSAQWLCAMAETDRWDAASDYCLTPHLLLFCAARAYAAGAPGLAPLGAALPAAVADLLTPPQEHEPFRLACLAATLGLAGEHKAAKPYLKALLSCQSPDGAWPGAASYSGYPPHLDGSPALTTAIALEALLAV
ncbi:MAG: hypothetical protein HC822_00895 [Oscillochloris sp.]|nr:hypothetical protein [Oscillochloris sp.]